MECGESLDYQGIERGQCMTMLSRSQQAMAIFQQALEYPPADQARFVERACQGQPSLLIEVQQLVQSHRETAGFSQAVEKHIGGIAEIVLEAGAREALKLIGQKLNGRYLIERVLGSGGMGRVYQARDQQVHQRPVVVKVLLETSAQNEWVVRKFLHESEALARIDHPNVVKVLDRGEFDHQPFLVMEFIKGEPLTARLKTGPLPLAEVAAIVYQICQALSAAHTEGIVHRDLKPDNIMIWQGADGSRAIKLIDFGVARIVEPQSAEKTVVSVPVGTLPYMAAEVINGEDATLASDIYSLGVIVYEMVTGARPFQVDCTNQFASLVQYWDLQRSRSFLSPRALRPELPEAGQRVIEKALAFHPQDRFASVAQFEQELLQTLSGSPGYRVNSVPASPSHSFHLAETLVSTTPDLPKSVSGYPPAIPAETLPGVGFPPNSLSPHLSSAMPGPQPGLPTLPSQAPSVFSPSRPLDATIAAPHPPLAQPVVQSADSFPPLQAVQTSRTRIPVMWVIPALVVVAALVGFIALLVINQVEDRNPVPAAQPSKPVLPVPALEGNLSLKHKISQQTDSFRLETPEKTILCETGDELRLSIKVLKTGYVYILNESPSLNAQILPNFVILFPSKFDNQGSSRFETGHEIHLPPSTSTRGLVLGNDKGTEKLWLVWSLESVAELEAVKTLANPRDQGIVRKKEQIEAVTKALARQQGQTTVHCLKLEHQ